LICIRPAPIGPDKAEFHRYLDDFGGAADPQALLAKLANCRDPLPARYADELGLPSTATYRDAVALLLAPWQPTLRSPTPLADE
jgi:hypothetical protein